MSIANHIVKNSSYQEFFKNTSKLINKGNWKKNRLGKDVSFELLSKVLLSSHPIFKNIEIKKIWHETEIPLRIKKEINYPEEKTDDGIDLIFQTKKNKFGAVQCKFLSDITDRPKIGGQGGLSTFFNLAQGKCKNIDYLFVFSTSINPPKKIRLVPKKTIFYLNSLFLELDDNSSTYKWGDVKKILLKRKIVYEKYREKDFQKKALIDLKQHFINNNRGSLFLPCGTGKSLIGYWFSKYNNYKTNIILVPNLSLVSQTLKVWVNQSIANNKNIKWLVVCSDKDINLNNDPFVANTKELPFKTTTNETEIKKFILDNKNDNFVIIATYNSSHKISSSINKKKFKFDLAIFDEAHRTVGTKNKLFSKLLYEKNINIEKRLFMTATKRLVKNFKDIIDMNDEKIYGKVAHEMSFKQAIESKEKILSDYNFISKGIDKEEIYSLWKQNPNVRHLDLDETNMKYMSSLILMFKTIKKYNLKKGISFHNSINSAKNFKIIAETYQKYLNPKNDIQLFHISSRNNSSGDKYSIIKDFENDKKSIITNARCLVEGVDVPAVDFVIFVDKKRSRTDIIQAIGRCLRLSNYKKFGYVIVPFIFDKRIKRDDFLKTEYADVVKSIRVLALYDKTFADNIKLQAKSKKSFSGNKVQIEILNDDRVIDIEDLNNQIRLHNFKRIGPLNFLKFEEAKSYVREKKIKTAEHYKKLFKDGELDPDLPAVPKAIYEDEGYTNWGDFLGTGSYATRKTVSYKIFLKIVRDLKIKEGKEYLEIPLEKKIELGIPSNPFKHYKLSKSEASWGKILNTGYVATFKRKYMPLNKIKSYLKPLKIPSNEIYEYWVSKGKRKEGIKRNGEVNKKTEEKIKYFISSLPEPTKDLPLDLRAHYGKKGKIKISTDEILGLTDKKYKTLLLKEIYYNSWWPFEKARSYVLKIDWKSLPLSKKVPGAGVANKWRAYLNGYYDLPEKPKEIPSEPSNVYIKEWKGWNHWMGSASFDFLDYNNCKKYLKKLNFNEIKLPKKYYIKKFTKKSRGKIIKVSHVSAYGFYRSLFDAYKSNDIKNLKFNKSIPRSPFHFFKKQRPFDWKDFLGID